MNQATETKVYPKRGFVYTAAEIENRLELRDGPSYRFQYHGQVCVIQTSHLTIEELLSVPGFAETRWTYERETFEWIPLFMAAPDTQDDILKFVDIEREIDINELYTKDFWVTPKGFPREQFGGRAAQEPLGHMNETITIQEAWAAAGGQGPCQSKEELLTTLRLMDEAIDECDEKHGETLGDKPTADATLKLNHSNHEWTIFKDKAAYDADSCSPAGYKRAHSRSSWGADGRYQGGGPIEIYNCQPAKFPCLMLRTCGMIGRSDGPDEQIVHFFYDFEVSDEN